MRLLLMAVLLACGSQSAWANLLWQMPHSVTLKYVSEGGKGQVTWLGTLYPESWPLPAYPKDVLRAGIGEGFVVLRFTVKEDCSISDIQVVRSSISDFESSAKEAVSRWKFTRPPGSKVTKWPSVMVECRFDFRVHEE
jgi:TonB family protein